MIRAVAYGLSEVEGKYFVQTCCNEEHSGQNCDCVSVGESFTEDEAIKMAKSMSKRLKVKIERW